MKTFTLDDIRNLHPCYDSERYAPEGWTGTLVDILDATQIPEADRIWVVTRLLDDRTNRLFAVWCARNALTIVADHDQSSLSACDTAERYANGLATAEELAAAWNAALDAARAASDAAWNAARAAALAARAAASDAAWNAARAARAAASDAALDAARAAARNAARNAASDAAMNAARAAMNAAWDAARAAAWDAQIALLREMILAIPEVREG